MLASRRKSLSFAASATLTRRLVDLAVVSPSSVFRDIINLFSALSHDYLLMDNKQLTCGVNCHISMKINPSSNIQCT